MSLAPTSPRSSPPKGREVDGGVLFELSPLDAAMLPFGFTILYIFPPPRATHPPYDPQRLRASLISTVDEDYPIFLGCQRIDPVTGAVGVWQSPEVRARGATTIPFTVDDAQALSTDEAMDQLPYSLLPARDGEQNVLCVKCTLLSDGGLVLGINASHCIVDGEGMFTFAKTWGMHYRGVPPAEREVINHDRHLLAPRGTGARLPHPEFAVPVRHADGDNSTTPPRTFPPSSQQIFHLTPEQMKSLKALATDESQGTYVSTIDAVTALLTMLISQARGHGGSVKITTGVNGRRRFEPPLPQNYAGNVIFNALSTYKAEELECPVSGSALQMIARRIRESILRRDEVFMRDAIEYLTSQEAKCSEVRVGTDFFFGRDLMFTSHINMGMYDADFGERPWYTGVPKLPCLDGMIIIMEGIRYNSGLDVIVFLEAQALKQLKNRWQDCALLQLA